MTGGGAGPEIDLIRDSVETATAKVQFYRVAFGAAGDQPVSLSDMGRLAADTRRGSRAALDWAADETAPRDEVRLAFLAILCAESAMPTGGTLTVGRSGTRWRIDGTAKALRVEPSLWQALSGGPVPHDIDAARIHFALAKAAAAALGAPIEVQLGEARLSIAFDARGA